MKSIAKTMLVSGIIAVSTIVFSSCEKESINTVSTTGNIMKSAEYTNIIDVAFDGTTNVSDTRLVSTLNDTIEASDLEIEGLLKMKDEEKLARDVYSTLNVTLNNRVFSNISKSENNHLNAIITLLQMYDPENVSISEAGIFANSDIQKLYTDLTVLGSKSLSDALKVGATIEDLDIKDLTVLIAATSNENIKLVYENLLKGSRNHLRAFVKQLSVLDQTYTPQYIDQATYDQIISSPFEKGNQYLIKNGTGNKNGTGKMRGKNKKHLNNQNGANCNL